MSDGMNMKGSGMRRMIGYAAAIVLALLAVSPPAGAQTFYGNSGLIMVPTATVLGNRQFVIGAGYMRDRWGTDGQPMGWFYQWAVHGGIGLLDRLEVSLRVCGVPGAALSDYTLPYSYPIDRMVSVKVVGILESEYIPSLAVGIQDIEGKPRRKMFNSLYAVASKGFQVPLVDSARVHVGYGSDVWDEITSVSNDHRLIGLFAGLELRLLDRLSLMAEYDTERFNVGARFAMESWPMLQVTFNGDGRLGVAAGYVFQL